MKETKKEKVWMIIGVMTLLLFGVGATFAYFVAQDGNAEQTGVNVLTHTTDSLVFEVGKAISITADQTSFAPGAGNRVDDTFARATLKANSSTNNATEHYYVYLAIDENTFEYTTEEKTAELILTINKVEGETKTPVTSIKGLNYVTVGEVSGFDVTDYNNLIMIANNYEITTSGTKIDEWEVILTLVNLNSNQNDNTGKVFNGTLLIQKEELLSGHIITQHAEDGTNNLYYHDGVGTYVNADQEAGDYSYRYNGGDYTISPAYQETYKRITKTATTDTDALLGFMCGTAEKLSSATCTEEIQYFYLTYETSETKTRYVTYKDALNKLIADGYLLETPVKNYVCFGSDEEICPQDNLYRIIGIIDGKTKLIKADYASKELLGSDGDAFVPGIKDDGTVETEKPISPLYKGFLSTSNTFYWNFTNRDLAYNETGNSSVWSYSELNKTNLNKNFLNNTGIKWAEKIATTTYYVSGGKAADMGGISSYPKKVFDIEVGEKKEYLFEPYKAKVGLLYISDYLYSANASAWKTPGKNYKNIIEINWLFLGGTKELTITRSTNTVGTLTSIGRDGSLIKENVYTSNMIRPAFYLNINVNFAGGTGTTSDPYRIK